MRLLSMLPLSVLLALPAWASTDSDLDAVQSKIDEITSASDELDHRIAPGRAHMSRNEAHQQFEDHLYSLMVGEFRPAAEGFFGLVTTGALEDPTLHRDAEWHLAEALYGMGNIVTAEARFRIIAEDDKHAFREDAVRRLLEVYAETNDARRFYDLYEREIVDGRVKPTSLITYTVARSFYKQADLDRAKQYFTEVAPEAKEFSRAQYFLGVVAIREGDLDAANDFFASAASASVTTPAQRQVLDLALLAQGRLAYESGDFESATGFYQSISGDSDYLADVLFETVWTFIDQEHFDEALQAVELFLLAFPEHQYSGELRVVEGHLHMGCGQAPDRCDSIGVPSDGTGDAYDRALATYEGIVGDFGPIRDRFDTLASSTDEPRLYFQEVLSDASKASSEGIPDFALSMMRDDVHLSSAIDTHRALQQQRRDVEACESLIAELQGMLSSDVGMGGYDSSKYASSQMRSRAARVQIELLGVEAAWLDDQGVDVSAQAEQLAELATLSTDVGAQLDAADAAKVAFEARVSELRSEIEGVETDVKSAESQLKTLRQAITDGSASDSERASQLAEISEVEAGLGRDRVRLGELRVELSGMKAPTSDGTGGDGLVDAINALRKAYKKQRPNKNSAVGNRFDAMHGELGDTRSSLLDVESRIDGMMDSELGRIRERFDVEVAEVAEERDELEALTVDSDRVSIALTRRGFQRMHDFFDDSVLKADLGIVDVFWARKLEIADERQRIQDERNAVVAELNRRFELIRQKMEQ